jgi:hypothetical protein
MKALLLDYCVFISTIALYRYCSKSSCNNINSNIIIIFLFFVLLVATMS